MPVIRIDTTATPTLTPEKRASLLVKLKNEFDQDTEHGPVIFQIPLGTDCMDVLVVWEDQDWVKLTSEERSRLILDAYDDDKREQIAQASGVTYDEAMQQQLLPYTIVSTFEKEPTFASRAFGNNKNEIEKLMAKIRDAKRANGGMVLPDGKIELRFPTRAMLDNVFTKLREADKEHDFYWSVVIEAAASDHLGVG